MRVVLDTNVLVRAHGQARGPAREVLEMLLEEPHVLVLSPFLLAEVKRVFSYPRVQALARLSPEEIGEYLESLDASCELVLPATSRTIIRADPDDDAVLQTARAGDADVLCTLDRHFHQPDALEFCSQHGIAVLNDIELLQVLRKEDE